MTSFAEVWDESVHGWLSEAEALWLWDHCQPPWCEVGCWKGRATRVLAGRGFGYAVDWFKGSPEHGEVDTLAEYLRNTAGLPVETIIGRFERVHQHIPSGLRFLFLDADHSEEMTRLALSLYEPKLCSGGVLALHDVGRSDDVDDPWPGVTAVAQEIRWPRMAGCERIAAWEKP